jgi:ribosomal protein L2
MALRKYKPVTAGTRWRIGNAFAEVTSDQPEKSLLEKTSSTGGEMLKVEGLCAIWVADTEDVSRG